MIEEKEKTEEKKGDGKLAVLPPILKSIQIALDSYDDIFSDFDESQYSLRVLSDDFLKEIKKRYHETKKGAFELTFTLPAGKRNQKTESIIKKRLRDYFKSEIASLNENVKKLRREGILRIATGFVLLSADVLLELYAPTEWYFLILGVLIVPAGWYSFYSGFDYLLEMPKKFEELKMFNEKFYSAKYSFLSEEEMLETFTEGEKKQDSVSA